MTSLELHKGDITKLQVDAIVNAANSTLLGGGGVDGAIHRAAGPLLLEECKTHNGCNIGEAKITNGYDLPATFVIHTVGPIYGKNFNRDDELLSKCYLNSLNLASKFKIKSIAFPSISTGAYGFPKDKAAAIAVKTVNDFIKANPASLEKIVFVVFSDEDFDIYKKLVP